MYTNVNFPAPLGVIALLGFGFLLLVVGAFLLYLLVRRNFGRARLAVLAAIVVTGLYLAVILIFSSSSSEQVLARGEEKHFCELDCHLAYSIGEVTQAKTIGNSTQPATAGGMFTVISVKTRFDEKTIGPSRGNSELYPNPRTLTLVDTQGRSYSPSPTAQAASQSGTPITTPLRPGESYTTTFIFDLPPQAKAATVLISESDWITHLIIGHENSLLHKKTRFQL
ncbi:MAG: hypothetical protein QOD75_2982 [Blastocatellia bacterium]|jgi:hypothetical protein|nr:hypothetical protein [Blastocatellia bacterium]